MKVSLIFGTRPEAIKLAPVILALKQVPDLKCQVCVTAQHRQMLDQVLEVFGITPDTDLNLMLPNQTLAGLTARAMDAIDAYLQAERPDLVLVQGDTTTVFCAALTAFYHHIPLGHVEAGLRTGNLQSPWPEELNRVLTTRLATLHFAPTESARQNLLREGVPDGSIHVTGNTVIDALFLALEKIRQNPPHIPGLPGFLQPSALSSPAPVVSSSVVCGPALSPNSQPSTLNPQLVLITGHRRENFGDGLESICQAIAELAARFPKVHFVYPVHLNPNVREPVLRILGQPLGSVVSGQLSVVNSAVTLPNVHLIEPLPYLPFVALMNRAALILTDSGGVQEEAPSLGKPVLVTRDTTERPEAVAAGTAKLVGTRFEAIVGEVSRLLADLDSCTRMSHTPNPYGDGKAAERIVEATRRFLRSSRE